MVIVDSCGWLEWFTDGALADSYKQYLADSDNILVPAIVLYEVYKVLKRRGRGRNGAARRRAHAKLPADSV